jgi:hypothetical protein
MVVLHSDALPQHVVQLLCHLQSLPVHWCDEGVDVDSHLVIASLVPYTQMILTLLLCPDLFESSRGSGDHRAFRLYADTPAGITFDWRDNHNASMTYLSCHVYRMDEKVVADVMLVPSHLALINKTTTTTTIQHVVFTFDGHNDKETALAVAGAIQQYILE